MWKRISAYMFDKILLFTLIVGCAFLLSFFFDFEEQSAIVDAKQTAVEQQFGVSVRLTEEEYNKLSEADKALYEQAIKALESDPEAQQAMLMLYQYTLILTALSVLLGYLILEFIVPLCLGNGRTVGKRLFGLAVMRIDGVRISPMFLFVRTFLGKYTLETMVPLFILVGLFFGIMGITGMLVLAIIGITNIVLLVRTLTRSAIHDMLSSTVCVDFTSQRIFDSPEAALAYKEQLHRELTQQADY